MCDTIDHFEYELTDYLGNVRATVKKTNETAELTSHANFYPFGMKMPGRCQLGSNPYPFAYQGQFAELDDETGFNAFTLRLWDNRISRWTITDPFNQYHSPYVGMGNSPVVSVDPTGGIPWWFIMQFWFDIIQAQMDYQMSHTGTEFELGSWKIEQEFIGNYWNNPDLPPPSEISPLPPGNVSGGGILTDASPSSRPYNETGSETNSSNEQSNTNVASGIGEPLPTWLNWTNICVDATAYGAKETGGT